jgi:hypothetical protein
MSSERVDPVDESRVIDVHVPDSTATTGPAKIDNVDSVVDQEFRSLNLTPRRHQQRRTPLGLLP